MSKFSGAVRVVVPATSANLGSGFDSAGLALSLFDEVEASFTDKPGVQVDVDGEGRSSLPRDENHLIAKVMLKTFNCLVLLSSKRPSLWVNFKYSFCNFIFSCNDYWHFEY